MRELHTDFYESLHAKELNNRSVWCVHLLLRRCMDEAARDGLITIDTDYRICISREAKEHYTNEAFDLYFRKYDGCKIVLPCRFVPSKEFIIFHNDKLSTF